MAFTIARTQLGGTGNVREIVLDVTADASTQTVETGLKVVAGFALGVVSAATMGFKVAPNSNASGVQSMGVLGISGLVSGDRLFIRVIGN